MRFFNAYSICQRKAYTILSMLLFVCIPDPSYASKAYLDILSNPEGVKVYINGKYIGATPITGVETKTKKFNLRAIKEGYGEFNKDFVVAPNEFKSIRIKLKSVRESSGKVEEEVWLEQDTGALMVINQIGPKAVYLDGMKMGTGSIKIDNITTGNHSITVGNLNCKILIYKNYILKVKIHKEGVTILNDLKNIEYVKENNTMVLEMIIGYIEKNGRWVKGINFEKVQKSKSISIEEFIKELVDGKGRKFQLRIERKVTGSHKLEKRPNNRRYSYNDNKFNYSIYINDKKITEIERQFKQESLQSSYGNIIKWYKKPKSNSPISDSYKEYPIELSISTIDTDINDVKMGGAIGYNLGVVAKIAPLEEAFESSSCSY